MAEQNNNPLVSSEGQIKGRFDSVSDQIKHFINPKPSAPGGPRGLDSKASIAIAKKALTNLHVFVTRQQAYFDHSIVLPEGFSKEYALNLTVDQAESDIEVIERIISQRSPATALFDGIKRLELADGLVEAALKPAKDAGLFPKDRPPIALTYFQKLASIRVVPYVNVALIGIPYSCLNNPADLLAIPHEAGHYVFWHGIIPETAASSYKGIQLGQAIIEEAKRRKICSTVLPWVEETFADVYAGLIAGALQARNLQDLIEGRNYWRELDKSPEAALDVVKNDSLTYDDGEHPLSVLRPLIHSETLRRIGNVSWALQLESRWKNRLQGKVSLRDGTFANDKQIRICQAQQALLGLVSLIDEMLRSLGAPEQLTSPIIAGSEQGWWHMPTKKVKPPLTTDGKDATDRLYEEFVQNLRNAPAATRFVDEVQNLDYEQWLHDLLLRDAALYAALEIKALDRPASRDWFVVLGSGGWTEGPDGPDAGGGGKGI